MTRVLSYGEKGFCCAAIVVLSSLVPVLCRTWLLSSAPLVQTMALTALSVCGSGVIALMEPFIRQNQQAAHHELPPLLFTGVQLSKRSRARDNENDMRDATDEHRERVRSVPVVGTQQSPKLVC